MQGFGFTEGFDIEIDTISNSGPIVRISFKKEKEGFPTFEFAEEIPLDILGNIAKG